MSMVPLKSMLDQTGTRADVLLTIAREANRMPQRVGSGVCLFAPEDAAWIVNRFYAKHQADILQHSRPRRRDTAPSSAAG
jgi:hypothetical protein